MGHEWIYVGHSEKIGIITCKDGKLRWDDCMEDITKNKL